MLRPFAWLFVGFLILPMLGLLTAFLSIGAAHPVELPAAGLATICLYLFAADLGWTLAGRSALIGPPGAILAMTIVAFGVPAGLNARALSASGSSASADATPHSLGTPQVVAILTPYESAREKYRVETDCEILCQRLLYWGNRKAVLMGASPTDGTPARATGLIRYTVDRRTTCPPTKVPEASVLSGQMRYGNSYATSETVEGRIAAGECLIATSGTIAEADVAAVTTRPGNEEVLRAGRNTDTLAIWRSAIFRRDGLSWTRVGQGTDRRFGYVRSPLTLRLAGALSLEPSVVEQTQPSGDLLLVEHALARWLGWPQGMPGGSQAAPQVPATGSQ